MQPGSSSSFKAKETPSKAGISNNEESYDAKESLKTEKQAKRVSDLRRRQRETLRAKATGKIDISNAPSANKRIVFDDNEPVNRKDITTDDQKVNDAESGMDKVMTSEPPREQDEESEVGHDSDEDAVEEVQTSQAHQQEKEQRSQERQSARASLQKTTKKRRRKKTVEQEEEEEDFDEDFFQQLEQERQAAKNEQRKAKKLASESKGRHTTFVVAEDDNNRVLPTTVEGIQVAVLSNIVEPTLSEPTEEAYIYSRSRLDNGSDGLSAKQKQKAKRRKVKPEENPSWQRSRKMNVLGSTRLGQNRGGRPAALFAKRK